LLILAQAAGEMVAELAEAAGPCAILGTFHQAPRVTLPPVVTVHSAPPLCAANTAGRLWSWLLYLIRAAVWVVLQPRSAHMVLFSNPPPLPALGYLLRKMTGRTYSVVVYDIYPDLLVRMGKLGEKGAIARMWRAVNRLAYSNAECVITLAPCMAESLAYQTEAHVEIIPPWVDTAAIRPLPKGQNPFAREHGQVGNLTVMYSGNMGISHDVETILAAAERLRDVPRLHFMFIGGGPKWDAVRRQAQGQPNITVLPWQSTDVFPYSIATADIAVVSLETAASRLEFPSKTISAMAAGAAVLAVSSPPNDLERLVAAHGCGCNVAPGDVEAFVDALLRWIENPAELERCRLAARRAAESHYSRHVNVPRMTARLPRTAPLAPAKRVLDTLGAFAGLLMLSPVMAVVAAAIRITMGAPVFFGQIRPGFQAQPFTLFKFRTMAHASEESGSRLPDEQRLTRLSRFLRATSLDELPQLWNVIKGDMSLVGPRPLLPEYLPRYNEFQRRRHEVKPGITGWAQVNGRNGLIWEQKFELDVWYVDHWSLWLDVKILWMTVLKVVCGKGISQAGHATMPEFLGSPTQSRRDE
jgi:lipopolysaccharide/colanic/teichoic acid biosynthesis glycosyltransferase